MGQFGCFGSLANAYYLFTELITRKGKKKEMVSAIFAEIGNALTGFISVISSGLTSITNLIYTPGTSDNPGSLTTFGTLLLIAAGVGVGYWLFRMIKGLVRAA